MLALRKNLTYTLCLFLLLLLFGQSSFAERAISEKLLPADLPVEEFFQPGSDLPVGKIQAVRGEVIVYHRDPNVGYPVKTGLPLYQGDTISTRNTGRILCRLIDGTLFSLSPWTTLTILQCNLNFARKTGVSFLSLKHGDGRFKVTLPTEIVSYEFKIQAVTAFAQARNADFVIKTKQDSTEIFVFEKSQLELTNLAAPEVAFLLTDFQSTVVKDTLGPQIAFSLSQEEAEAVMADIRVAPQTHLFASSAEKYYEEDAAAAALESGSDVEDYIEIPPPPNPELATED
jgi:hypothetical protein